MLARLAFSLANPQGHMPANANSGRLSSSANQCVTFGLLSVHSQNEMAGTNLIGGGFNLPDKLPRPDPVQCGIVTRMFQQRYGEKSKSGA